MDTEALKIQTIKLLVAAGFKEHDAANMVDEQLTNDTKTKFTPDKLMLKCIKALDKESLINEDKTPPGVMSYNKSIAVDKATNNDWESK